MKLINIFYGYIPKVTIDANKHPDEQINDLLKIIRNSNEDEIDIYCNSPYIINEMTVIEGYSNKQIPDEFKGKYKGITISNKHFEILENDDIIEGNYYKSMICDDNMLNMKLGESNDRYSDLLKLAHKIKKNENN